MPRSILLVSLLLVLFAACAPSVRDARTSGPEAAAAQRAAELAFHRMEIGRLETGSYTSNVLVDVEVPRGVKLTLLDFAPERYLISVTHDALPGLVWQVTPSGVRLRSA